MMANYGNYNGGGRGVVPPQNVSQPQVQPQVTSQVTPNYSDWINPQPTQPQQPVATEQRGITAVYTVHSRAEYSTIYPPAGQTIAIFNFPDSELCLKAMDVWGLDLGIRTFSLKETTPSVQPAQLQQTPVSIQETSDPIVSKAEFDDLRSKIDSLYRELKGEPKG